MSKQRDAWKADGLAYWLRTGKRKTKLAQAAAKKLVKGA